MPDTFTEADHERAVRAGHAAMANVLRERADQLEGRHAKPERAESAKVKRYRRGFWLWLLFSAACASIPVLFGQGWMFGLTPAVAGFICALVDLVKGVRLADAEKAGHADA
jgi:hypothetical protein